MKKLTTNKIKIAENWIADNGACNFDFKNGDVILYDGGLFSIEERKIKRHKIKGFKKLLDGSSQVIFSKKKYPSKERYVNLWISEIDETIDYFKRMKKMLNKIGFKTDAGP